MRRPFATSSVAALSIVLAAHMAPGQTTASQQSEQERIISQLAPKSQLRATIVAVQGMVKVRTDASAAWVKCDVGMILGQGAEFRTGLRSSVQFSIPPDQTITLDRLGSMTLLQAVADHGKVTTDLGMKYGRTRYEIEAAGVEHVSTIHAPNSTMAVRGTTVALTDQRPFPPEAISLTGTAQYSSAKREMTVGGKGTGIATAVGTLPPADQALFSSVVDPSNALAREPGEAQLIAAVQSRGSVVSEFRGTGIPIITGGRVPSDTDILGTLSDPLVFILRWTGNTNLDLSIGFPTDKNGQHNEFLYPAPGLNVAPNGANIPFDHQGGPNGGFEIAEFPAPIVPGRYDIGINYVSGAPTSLTAEAFLNRQPVGLFEGNPLVSPTQLVTTVGPRPKNVNTATAIGLVGIKSIFGNTTEQTANRRR